MTCLAAALLAVGCISSPTDPADQGEPTSVEIAPAELQARGGTFAHFDAVVRDASGQPLSGTFLEWTTTDPSVAIVDTQGNVWSFSEGTVTATATFPGRGRSSPGGKAYGHSKQDAKIEVTEVEPGRPGRVSDLAVVDTTGSSVTLEFTEVDDGTGSPAEYLVRFQIAPLDWATAANVVQGTCKSPVRGDGIGTSLRCRVEGLADGTMYGFQLIAVRATDGVYGDLSNLTTGRTYDVAQPELSGGGVHPHEPSGLTAFSSVSMSDSINAELGTCTERESSESRITYESDPSTPTGDGWALRGRFPSGASDGSSYWRFDCWGPGMDAAGGSFQYDEIYVSLWLKVDGNDYENQTVGTKIFYWASGEESRHNDHALYLHNGTGAQALQSEMSVVTRLSKMDDNGEDTSGLQIPNRNWDEKVRVGQWNQIEVRAKINSIGPTRNDGELDVWLNGVLVTSIDDWRYRSDENPRAFYHLQFTPVWGGYSGDVRTRDDHWRIDELYISGR